jgi:hypothetical protein
MGRRAAGTWLPLQTSRDTDDPSPNEKLRDIVHYCTSSSSNSSLDGMPIKTFYSGARATTRDEKLMEYW